MKECSNPSCRQIKPVNEFHRANDHHHKDGHCSRCKECESRRKKIQAKDPIYMQRKLANWRKYYHRNIKRLRHRYKKYDCTPEGRLKRRLKYAQVKKEQPEVWKARRQRKNAWYKTPEFKKKRNAKLTYRRQSDLRYRLHERLRCLTFAMIRNGHKGRKMARSMELVGCSVEEFKQYIEKLWLPGMNWKNYGRKEGQWSLDHIICCALFDFTKLSHQKAALHYTNIRPLWHIDNIFKSDRLADGRRAYTLSKKEKKQVLIGLGFGHLFP